jgi:hypothetical protein
VSGLRKEVGELTGVESSLALGPRREQLEPARIEAPMEVRDEGQRFWRKDVVGVLGAAADGESGG